MPVRLAPSPVAAGRGWLRKPAPPSPYDGVRAAGVATLLLSSDGSEILEACVAAVLSWDGTDLACAPSDRPRVWSTAEAAVRDHMSVREAPIPVDGTDALLLVNAVKGTCTVVSPGRPEFPAKLRREIDQLFVELTAWPALRA
jgi:hypothetical protein